MVKFILPVRFGVALSTSLIAYFLVLSLFDLHTNPLFSLFNGVITGFAIFEAIRFRRIELNSDYSYAKGFSAGIVTGFIGTLLFTIFMTLYATEVSPNFIEQIATNFANSYNIGVGIFAFVVAVMGLATTVVLTLSFMQLFKRPLETKD